MPTFVKLTVGGTDFRDMESLNVTRSIGENNASSRADAMFPNHDGLHKDDFSVGDEVTIFADKDVNPPTTKIMTGVITEITFTGKGSNKERMKLMIRGFNALLQRTTVEPSVFTDDEISTIVTNLMANFGPNGVTTTNVNVTGTILRRIVFKQVNLFDALKELAELAGDFFFYVDVDKDLHFEKKNQTSSGLTFDETNVRRSRFREDIDKVRNRIFVYGDRQLVAHPTENLPANGGSVFTLDEAPHNTAVSVSGVQQQGGILDLNLVPPSGTDYLVSFHDKQLVFVSGTDLGYSSIPASGGSVVVDYFASRPIIKFARDNASIAAYNKRTQVLINEDIKDPDMAADIAKNQVRLLKDPKLQGDIDIQGIVAITPGNTVVVNLPFENIVNETFQILDATYNFNPKNNEADDVLKVRVSERIGDLTDILKDIILRENRLDASRIDTSGILSRLEFASGSFGLRVKEWFVRTKTIGNSFVLGHAVNGQLGSPQVATGGGQVVLGSGTQGAFVIARSGT